MPVSILRCIAGLAPRGLGRGLDLAQLVERSGHGDVEVVADELRDLRAENAAEHEDRHANAGAAQRDALFEEGHADVALVDAPGLEVFRHRHQSVAVGVLTMPITGTRTRSRIAARLCDSAPRSTTTRVGRWLAGWRSCDCLSY